MSYLKPGTRCVIVGGCPENIGLIVEIVVHIGHFPPYDDACRIRTVSGRFFSSGIGIQRVSLIKGLAQISAITDRHKLRPLVDPKDESKDR